MLIIYVINDFNFFKGLYAMHEHDHVWNITSVKCKYKDNWLKLKKSLSLIIQ